MVTTLMWLTAFLYGLASSLYVYHLAKGTKEGARWAAWVLAAAALSQAGFMGFGWANLGHPPASDIHQALAAMSLIVVVVFLLTARSRDRLRVLGAFITPVTLLLFLGAAFRRQDVPAVPEGVRSALLPVHVAVNVLGLAAFAFAFAFALAYVIQERQLRQKNLGGLFQRLPALDVLDRLGLRAVLVGFPLLTIGVVTGTMWIVRDSLGLSPTQGFGLLAWLLFAGVLLLRVAAGWRGKKAAIGTMLGFLSTLAVLAGYVLRDTWGGGA
ncbi:MAG: cytochrome c biogenesis protein CcsA [Sandaracinaceae bacterium]|nr:cytochrome c biogenesis protein CcsA [Sandaracinaceae bacterium]